MRWFFRRINTEVYQSVMEMLYLHLGFTDCYIIVRVLQLHSVEWNQLHISVVL